MPSAEKIMETPESRTVSLFIGRSGGGKSTAAYSYPRPMKILDIDGRVRGGLSNSFISLKGIDVETFPPRAKEPFYVKLNKELEVLYTLGATGQLGGLQTLVYDSLTFTADNLLIDAIPLTHGDRGENKGKKMGSVDMAGPEDYSFQAINIFNILTFLKSLPIPNIIVTAHIVNKYGKAPGAEKFSPNVIVGEQLLLTDKLAEKVPGYFDHIFRFSKDEVGDGRVKFFCKFNGELERTAFPELLKTFPQGEFEITNRNFYEGLSKLIKKEEAVSGKV